MDRDPTSRVGVTITTGWVVSTITAKFQDFSNLNLDPQVSSFKNRWVSIGSS